MRWSYFLCLSFVVVFLLLLQDQAQSFPTSIEHSDLIKRESSESDVVLVKRVINKIKKLFGGGTKTPPAHVPKPGHFDPASAHEPPPLRQGTKLPDGYKMPEHMQNPKKSDAVYFDPSKMIGAGSSSPKKGGK
ncbi:uncharacterized protein FA14DRAFT_175901 [Meira miltonrushii]|uniref:Uncharacterized protein n=1 Tax=Meira miltonrushii TaxID=1280837 RepID=A0A316VHS6_9BASI|nr:uncharacterized protein FA14DRAFT_175901 [Meira miltonrushii]PWN36588.1 hypothetical protein FA14DRAFT_175901 [Meira miltonrushii]